MKNCVIIFRKQMKDILKNKSILIQFILFPAMTVILNNAIDIEGMPENFFVTMFAAMYLGMAPLVSMASIISEEKEQNTLRVLLLSNVKPLEYLTGIGSSIMAACLLGSVVFCIVGKYRGRAAVFFMLLMAVGILTSMLIGAVIGIWSKNQMTATSITVPVMMVFAFLPMISMFNETIAKVAGVTYTEQISRMMNDIQLFSINSENVIVIGINILLALSLFLVAWKKAPIRL